MMFLQFIARVAESATTSGSLMSILLHASFVGGNARTGLCSVRLPVVMADDALFFEGVGLKLCAVRIAFTKRTRRRLADRFWPTSHTSSTLPKTTFWTDWKEPKYTGIRVDSQVL